jgi:hypothetical protein
MERKWIAFQLIAALADCHELKVILPHLIPSISKINLKYTPPR